MAKRKAADDNALNGPPTEGTLRRIANLLAVMAIKGEDDTGKIKTLNSAGYDIAEIAKMLGKKPNDISVALYRMRKKPRRGRG